MKLLLVFFVAILSINNACRKKSVSEELSIQSIQELKKKKCVLFHVWATWCPICLQEIPQLVERLNKEEKITPVIIDVSSRSAHESFSKKWFIMLETSFKVFYKSLEDQNEYFKAINDSWDGTLPHTVLYVNGLKKKEWQGELNIEKLFAEIHEICRQF